MPAARAAKPTWPLRPWLWAIAAITLAGVILGVLGPFGSYLNGGWATRIAYWVASMWLGIVTYGVGFTIARKLAPRGTRWAWPVLILSTLAASIPQATITRAFAFWLWPELAELGLAGWIWYLQVATIGLAAVPGGALILQIMRSRTMPISVEQTDGQTPPGGSSPRLSGPILALQMEDHYVRVHDDAGSDLVLMTLGQAMEAVRATEGLRIHRSWWVARHAVTAVEGSPRSMNLRLSNGIVAPVARSAVAQLRAAGWLNAG